MKCLLPFLVCFALIRVVLLKAPETPQICPEINFHDLVEENRKVSETFKNLCHLRIVGGFKTEIEDIPYQVGLAELIRKKRWEITCGGSLVTLRYVVSAAHCKDSKTKQFVIAGNTNTKIKNVGDKSKPNFQYWKSIKCFYLHHRYETDYYSNDIAVVEMESEFQKSSLIRPIRMHTPDLKMSLTENSVSIVSGFGNTDKLNKSSKKYRSSKFLQAVCVPVVSHKTCGKYYDRHVLKSTTICLGVEGKDSCQGDSGGPAVLDGILIGVVSLGIECGPVPGVYTKILSYTSDDYVAFKNFNQCNNIHGNKHLLYIAILLSVLFN